MYASTGRIKLLKQSGLAPMFLSFYDFTEEQLESPHQMMSDIEGIMYVPATFSLLRQTLFLSRFWSLIMVSRLHDKIPIYFCYCLFLLLIINLNKE